MSPCEQNQTNTGNKVTHIFLFGLTSECLHSLQMLKWSLIFRKWIKWGPCYRGYQHWIKVGQANIRYM